MSALVADDERASRQATGSAGLNVGRASHEMGFQLERSGAISFTCASAGARQRGVAVTKLDSGTAVPTGTGTVPCHRSHRERASVYAGDARRVAR